MSHFLKQLVKKFTARRPARPARAQVAVEGLEERLALSSAPLTPLVPPTVPVLIMNSSGPLSQAVVNPIPSNALSATNPPGTPGITTSETGSISAPGNSIAKLPISVVEQTSLVNPRIGDFISSIAYDPLHFRTPPTGPALIAALQAKLDLPAATWEKILHTPSPATGGQPHRVTPAQWTTFLQSIGVDSHTYSLAEQAINDVVWDGHPPLYM